MVWQDFVIAIASIMFSLALIPQIYAGFKSKRKYVKFQTAIITFIGLYITSVSFLTLGLYFSTLTSFTSALFWYMILIQSVVYK